VEDRISVVVVDDVTEVRKALRWSLETDGRFEIVGEAWDGRTAMRRIESEKPNGVVLDLLMPLMDGYNAMSQIKFSSPETKILVYSSVDDPEDFLHKRGADAVIRKDEPMAAVADRLAQLCWAASYFA
jgi:two-component system, chemotaxis family, protein-glutamate methylesterase/glutaminase